MSKKLKIIIILVLSAALVLWWAALAYRHIKLEMVNYWWQAALSVITILFGIFGLVAAKHWSWLKSGVGRGLFFLSLGMIMWGIGQAGWSYLVIKNPNDQTPPSHVLDVLYSSSIPLWFYGMLKLSKATGARYGLRSTYAKIGVAVLIAVMFAVSYYFLVNVARGGSAYFHKDTVLNIIFDLGYAAGDAVNLTLALAIFGLSWKYLGGRFKLPILLILIAFAIIYFADFFFSFYDGKGQYYNGHWSDLLYALWAAVFGLGLCLLDPTGEPARVPLSSAAPQPATNSQPAAAVPPPVPAAPAAPTNPSLSDLPSLSPEPADNTQNQQSANQQPPQTGGMA